MQQRRKWRPLYYVGRSGVLHLPWSRNTSYFLNSTPPASARVRSLRSAKATSIKTDPIHQEVVKLTAQVIVDVGGRHCPSNSAVRSGLALASGETGLFHVGSRLTSDAS